MAHPSFEYSAESCDVTDRKRLVAYRKKRLEWLALLREDEKHSVNGQITALLWQDACFHLFNEMRKGAPGNRPPTITSPLLAEALDNGYVTNMILGIGRLVDAATDVVSLRRVFDDVRANRDLITREIFVCCDGLRFDPSTIPTMMERGARPGEPRWTKLGGPLDATTPRLLHETFDRLSGVMADGRKRTDKISDKAFEEISGLLANPAIATIKARRNKFVAHAADPKSRRKVDLEGYSISMAGVEKALRAILKATDKLQGNILQAGGTGLMATAQFNVLEGLGASMTDQQIEELQNIWERLAKARNEWHK